MALVSESLTQLSWPHAMADCPRRRRVGPCGACYCFVCDVPVGACEAPVAHAGADGKHEEWRRAKRLHHRLRGAAWDDVPALVDLVIALAVEEATGVARPTPRSPTLVAAADPFEVEFVGSKPHIKEEERDAMPVVRLSVVQVDGDMGKVKVKEEVVQVDGDVGEAKVKEGVVQVGGGFGELKLKKGVEVREVVEVGVEL